MKVKNMGEKYVKTLQIRINQDQSDFIDYVSGLLGVTPSEYVRMIINVYMSTSKGERNEDIQSGSDNIL